MTAALKLLSAVLMLVAGTFSVAAIADSAPPSRKVKLGMRVATSTGDKLFAAFSVRGASQDIDFVVARMVELNCPNPLVSDIDGEKKIFAPFSEGCDRDKTLELLTDIQAGKYPSLHSLDVQILPAAPKSN